MRIYFVYYHCFLFEILQLEKDDWIKLDFVLVGLNENLLSIFVVLLYWLFKWF